jgi:hypothetical protein
VRSWRGNIGNIEDAQSHVRVCYEQTVIAERHAVRAACRIDGLCKNRLHWIADIDD